MKTPTEKAKEILEKVRPHAQYWDCYNDRPLEVKHAVKLALLLVDEILAFMKLLKWDKKTNGNVLYWQEVRKEITRKRV
jgi:hypothetical protein